MCERWRTFENFLADMGARPDGMTLDRIDSTGHYEPGNCRWATMKQQQRNKSSNHLITYQGRTLCVSEWAEVTGIPRKTLFRRLQHGFPIERLFEPLNGYPRPRRKAFSTTLPPSQS